MLMTANRSVSLPKVIIRKIFSSLKVFGAVGQVLNTEKTEWLVTSKKQIKLTNLPQILSVLSEKLKIKETTKA